MAGEYLQVHNCVFGSPGEGAKVRQIEEKQKELIAIRWHSNYQQLFKRTERNDTY